MKPDHSLQYMQELKTRLSKKYPQLTTADLFSKADSENDMLRMVAYKLRKTKQEMLKIIGDL